MGRVPAAQIILEDKTYRPIDARFYWREMPDNFEPSEVFPWFDRNEFLSLGIDVPEDYFRAAEIYWEEGLSDLPSRIEEYEARTEVIIEGENGENFSLWKKMAEDYRATLQKFSAEKTIFEDVEKQFDRFLEVGWSKLFQLVHAGEVTIQAIELARWERLVDEDDYEAAASFENLQLDDVKLSFDWRNNRTDIASREYVATRVTTAEIVSRLNDLIPNWVDIPTQRFGAFHRVYATQKSVFKRGRPPVVDWEMVRAKLQTMHAHNALPDNKESCIFHLVAYCEKDLGRKVSRSSVQRHIGEELKKFYG